MTDPIIEAAWNHYTQLVTKIHERKAFTDAVTFAVSRARVEALEKAAMVVEPWTKTGELLLRAGELNAEERRLVLAIARAITDGIRTLIPATPAKEEK